VIFMAAGGKQIPLLDITSVVEAEDGSVEVHYRGQKTKLTGEHAHAYLLATSGPYRAQQEEYQPGSILARKLASLRVQQEERKQ
jgi:hypothetical protein